MDFLPNKGIEYLIVIGYLLVLLPFWLLLARGSSRMPAPAAALYPAQVVRNWFRVPEGLHFHLGHAWAAPEERGLFRVGLDDFAQKLIGPLARVELPPPGTALVQGERAFRLHADSKSVGMLSPLDGTVVAVNDAVAVSPQVVSEEPYGRGWLLKVRPSHLDADLKQLLEGELARKWMEAVSESLRTGLGPDVGQVLQDGGQPVNGIARELHGDRWDEFARIYLLS